MPGSSVPAMFLQRARFQAALSEAPAVPLTPSMKYKAVLSVPLYIVLSAVFIESNNFIMGPSRFPFPVAACLIQMVMAMSCTWMLYYCKPAIFPSAEAVQANGGVVQMREMVFKLMPLGVALAGTMYCSNLAYQYCSVPLVQMLEHGNLFLAFVLASLVFGMEQFSWTSLGILAIISAGGCAACTGAVIFTWYGLCMQLVAQVCDVSRILGQSVYMSEQRQSHSGNSLDPLSLILFMTPGSVMCLTALFVLMHQGRADAEPVLIHFLGMWPHLALNGVVACGLLIVAAFTLSAIGAVNFVLVGVAKDVIIVAGFSAVLHQPAGYQRLFGCVVALAGIAHYALYKTNPECFTTGNPVQGFMSSYHGSYRKASLLFTRAAAKGEKEQLTSAPA